MLKTKQQTEEEFEDRFGAGTHFDGDTEMSDVTDHIHKIREEDRLIYMRLLSEALVEHLELIKKEIAECIPPKMIDKEGQFDYYLSGVFLKNLKAKNLL